VAFCVDPPPSTWWSPCPPCFKHPQWYSDAASSVLHNLFTFTNWPTAPPQENGKPSINRTQAPVLWKRRLRCVTETGTGWFLCPPAKHVDGRWISWWMGSLFCVTLNLFHLHLVWTVLSPAWQRQCCLFIYLFKRLKTRCRHKSHVHWYNEFLWI